MLDRVHGVSLVHQTLRDVAVATAVLTGTVRDDDISGRVAVAEPRTPEDLEPARTRERGLARRGHSSAQGTITASSSGESRATTYSAGSLSETFSSTCVSRGGTYTRSPGSSTTSCSSRSPHLTSSEPVSMYTALSQFSW